MPVETLARRNDNGNHSQQVGTSLRADSDSRRGRTQNHHPNPLQLLFEAADDRLTLTATDLDLSLRTSCATKVKKDGSCTIPARKLYDYVKCCLPERRYHRSSC